VGQGRPWTPLNFEIFSKKGCFLSFGGKNRISPFLAPLEKFRKYPLVVAPGKNPSTPMCTPINKIKWGVENQKLVKNTFPNHYVQMGFLIKLQRKPEQTTNSKIYFLAFFNRHMLQNFWIFWAMVTVWRLITTTALLYITSPNEFNFSSWVCAAICYVVLFFQYYIFRQSSCSSVPQTGMQTPVGQAMINSLVALVNWS